MRHPNRKRKPKHMTRCKYKDYWLAISKCTKKVSMKPPIDLYDLKNNVNYDENYKSYRDWYDNLKNTEYIRHGNTNWLQNKNRWKGF